LWLLDVASVVLAFRLAGKLLNNSHAGLAGFVLLSIWLPLLAFQVWVNHHQSFATNDKEDRMFMHVAACVCCCTWLWGPLYHTYAACRRVAELFHALFGCLPCLCCYYDMWCQDSWFYRSDYVYGWTCRHQLEHPFSGAGFAYYEVQQLFSRILGDSIRIVVCLCASGAKSGFDNYPVILCVSSACLASTLTPCRLHMLKDAFHFFRVMRDDWSSVAVPRMVVCQSVCV